MLYIILLIVLIVGWTRQMRRDINTSKSSGDAPVVSVIIPARNEGKCIGLLLQDLTKQHDYRFQAIIVDDHSEDDTREVVRHEADRDNRFQLHRSGGVGKKEALSQGIDLAQGSIIVTTDADCRVGEDWLAGLRACFVDEHIQMVFGGVRMANQTFFEKVQAIEFLSLIGVGAATAAIGLPTVCNGANLAFRKTAFESVHGYQGNLHIPSGDDEFLMKKILQKYPGGLRFVNDPRTVVTTAPNADLRQFINQRIRWAGKWKLHQSGFSKVLAAFIFCFYCAVIVLPIGVLMHWVTPAEGLFLWSFKLTLEFIFLWQVSRFVRVCWSWRAFILLQVVYPFYATLIGLASNINYFEWKGRKLKSLMPTTGHL